MKLSDKLIVSLEGFLCYNSKIFNGLYIIDGICHNISKFNLEEHITFHLILNI